MNIGFYGKGGSGKTTLSALFSLYLDAQGKTTGLLDADVNSHTADVLGVTVDDAKLLSAPANEADIWRYLAGGNRYVDPAEFLNTTPPGEGSGRWRMSVGNYITGKYGQPFGENAHLFTVGSYSTEAIGTACYHTAQSVAENMISHLSLDSEEVLVVDSVAGNDAFGTTLFLNDLLVFVVKPEREGISVMSRFLQLAEAAGVGDRVVVLGNQVGSETQQAFLKREIPSTRLIGMLPVNNAVIDTRLEDRALSVDCIEEEAGVIFSRVYELACQKQDRAENYKKLLELHRKVSAEDWVSGAYRAGLSDQIDAGYIPV